MRKRSNERTVWMEGEGERIGGWKEERKLDRYATCLMV